MVDGLQIRTSQKLIGQKHAIQFGAVLYVSPAMHSLIEHADQDELRHLMANIRIVNMSCLV